MPHYLAPDPVTHAEHAICEAVTDLEFAVRRMQTVGGVLHVHKRIAELSAAVRRVETEALNRADLLCGARG